MVETINATQAPQSGLIPTPPDFPITWEQPGDERIFWNLDRMHFPNQITPLIDSLLRSIFSVGFNRAAERYSLPIRAAARRFNTYHYEVMAPPPLAPEELHRLGEAAQQLMGRLMANQLETWQNEWLPAIKRELAAWQTFDLAAAGGKAFLRHLDESLPRLERLWEMHFSIVLPVLPAMSLFQEIYRDLLGADDEFDALRLLQGFQNETLRANRALWQLAQSAKGSAFVREIIETTSGTRVRAALAGAAEGRAFLAELEEFLEEFGRRGSDFGDADKPSWIEDPTPALAALKAFIASDAADPEEERQALAASRDRLLATVRQRLQGYPEQAVGQFEFMLKAAQDAAILSEDHGFYIDWQGTYEMRRVMVEAGKRVAATWAIDEPDDVFYLYFDEVRAVLAAPGAHHFQAQVARRKAEMAHFSQIIPPQSVGTLPPGPPPDDALGRAMLRFFGGPPPVAESPDTLRGNAGSPGKVTGRARLIRSLAEAEGLQPGDILVAETTTPPWTPLFASVAAVVTDTGGVLSHSAVVAREYSLPAVVGTGLATKLIREGQLIEVDGTNGIVRLLAD